MTVSSKARVSWWERVELQLEWIGKAGVVEEEPVLEMMVVVVVVISWRPKGEADTAAAAVRRVRRVEERILFLAGCGGMGRCLGEECRMMAV